MSKKRIVRNIFVVLLGAISILPVSALAQCPVSVAVGGDGPRTKTEMNIGVGGVYTMLQSSSPDVMLKPNLGYHGNVQFTTMVLMVLKTHLCHQKRFLFLIRKRKCK